MAQAGYDPQALESCRAALDSAAGPVGAVGDTFDGQHVDGAIFGQLDAVGRIVAAVTNVNNSAKQQFHNAEQLLRSASRAVDAVRTSIENTDAANAQRLGG